MYCVHVGSTICIVFMLDQQCVLCNVISMVILCSCWVKNEDFALKGVYCLHVGSTV